MGKSWTKFEIFSYFSEVEYPKADLPVDEKILHLKKIAPIIIDS